MVLSLGYKRGTFISQDLEQKGFSLIIDYVQLLAYVHVVIEIKSNTDVVY